MRTSAAEKLQRLISIVSWTNAQDGPTVEEVCERFAIGRAELIAQLNMASLVGDETGEFSDMPIEVFYEDDRVHVYLTAFQRPLRLTPAQALALLSAGAAVLQLQSAQADAPLARAVRKVAAVMEIDPTETVDVDLGEADSEVLELLRSAVEERTPMAIVYWSAGRDHWTERTVEPWRVFNQGGAWYLQAWCRSAGGERVFRIDRVDEIEPAAGAFEPPSPLPEAVAYRAGADDPRVVLDLDADARWVAGAYPIDRAEELAGGHVRVTMPAGASAFLARLLLRLGHHASVIEAGDRSGGTATAVEAARRILLRYAADVEDRSE